MPQCSACNRPIYYVATPLKQPYWRVVLDRGGPSGTTTTADGSENIVVTAAGVAARRRGGGKFAAPPGFLLSFAKNSCDSLRSTEVRQPVQRPKPPSPVGGRATGIVSPPKLAGHTDSQRRTGRAG
jgi:hypothetical protein